MGPWWARAARATRPGWQPDGVARALMVRAAGVLALTTMASSKCMDGSASDSANRFLAEHHGRFLAFLRTRVASDAMAEDILQDAYAKSLEKIDDVRDEESVVAWFYSILKNAVTDHYRKAGVERRVHAELGQEGEPSFEPELRANICSCMSAVIPTLKPEYAEIVGEVELRERSIAEVASDRGLTANNATVRLHRARAALRRRLVEICGSCSTHGCLDCTCRHAP
jgi:RNA polymerase sigma factor (sigma-70 family)